MNVIVTGASKGIGRAVAAAFAAEGADLFLCARNEATLQQTVTELQTAYPKSTIKANAFDVSKKKEAIAFGNWCLKSGTPDILVNNAGSFLPGSIYNEEDGLLEKMIETNLYSAYHVTRAVVSKMMVAKHGRIFNICSIASLHAYPNG